MASIIQPKTFAHVVYRTYRFQEMLDWYVKVFGGKIQYQNPVIAFVTYDEEHHRVALLNLAIVKGESQARTPRGQPGMDHVAYGYRSLRELLDKYLELKAIGVLPYWCIHHGITVSLYYADPDGNQMEFQTDSYTSNEDANAFMYGPRLRREPDRRGIRSRRNARAPAPRRERGVAAAAHAASARLRDPRLDAELSRSRRRRAALHNQREETSIMTIDRRSFSLALGTLGASTLWSTTSQAQPAGTPVRIGGTLALTGPLSSVGLVHKLTGEIYVDELNKRGGLLGRPVEWIVKDDQSKPDLTRTLYEQLVNSDKVDLLIGPYGTSAILSAMGVAQRYNKILVHHTFGVPPLAKYPQQFYGWAVGPEPDKSTPGIVLDALAAAGKTPKTVAIVTSKFPSVHYISLGAREVARQRGVREVLFLEWDFGNRDFGPVASRIKDADPDLIWGGALGLEANQIWTRSRRSTMRRAAASGSRRRRGRC